MRSILFELRKNFVETIDLNYVEEVNADEKKPTYLSKTTFNVAKFISGLAFDNSLINASNHPIIGNMLGIFIGGITSFNQSWESLYIDIDYFKAPSNGHRKAVIRCGASQYCDLFKNWPFYGIRVSMKSLVNTWPNAEIRDAIVWGNAVDDMAKDQYRIFKGVTPNDDYEYNLDWTLNEKRRDDKYVSYIFLGNDGKMYEYPMLYDKEKIEIVVTKGLFHEEVDRIDILPLLSPVSPLPDDKAALFDIMIQKT